jgi:hypothetical protein
VRFERGERVRELAVASALRRALLAVPQRPADDEVTHEEVRVPPLEREEETCGRTSGRRSLSRGEAAARCGPESVGGRSGLQRVEERTRGLAYALVHGRLTGQASQCLELR